MTQFEQLFNLMRKPWFILFYVLAVVLAYHYVDKSVATSVCQLHLATLVPSLVLFSNVGKEILYFMALPLAGVYFRYIRINPTYATRSWYLFCCIFSANLLCLSLKIVLGRARPELLVLHHEFGFYWFKFSENYWSFPSGHTTTLVSLAAGLGVLFPRYFYAFLCVALLFASLRILLCFHYLSDVMSAIYMSLLVVGFLTHLYEKRHIKLYP